MKKSKPRSGTVPWRLLGVLALLACGLVWAAGCAHTKSLNQPLPHFDATAGYRLDNLPKGTNSDELFVVLAFSGGGTRAAAFSYGVLEQLRQDHLVVQGAQKRVLDEVDVLSSVSGGSFTAAYYALFGDRIFEDFADRFLLQDVEGALLRRLLLHPLNWLRLLSPYFSRSDIATEYYEQHIFGGACYSNLLARGRPFLVVNATDLARGARLEFTQTQFDFLYSDLLPFSVARAVTASSAFPGALVPLTLRNYPAGADYKAPTWLTLALADRDVNSRRWERALTCASYLDKTNRPYIHLVDGGVADNLGLRGPLWSLDSSDWDWSLRRDIQNQKVKNVVVISVDAKTEPADAMDQRARPPGLLPVLLTAATMPMANYSGETAERLVEEFTGWQQQGRLYRALRAHEPDQYAPSPFHDVKFYPVYLGFDLIPDAARRRLFNDIGTSFNLSTNEVAQLRALGGELLRGSSEYQRLLKDFAR